MGFITFFHGNEYATNPDNMAKITKTYENKEKFKAVQKLLKEDIQGLQNVQNIAAQSFNVTLGALLSFLVTTISGKIKNNPKP
ncbi:hypothetical protein [Laspinema olomoucense]|uniref:Uncharacterized protein n=1 Tax=Laspinema olomoucense D3b TaxID=2953688 RepID=A0ABT2NAV1_9CYAN|nr:hypothetical protein [Laspinema sp. D3b]MCT7979837.1 hypothetical protein [Laspinema sp. D3b]